MTKLLLSLCLFFIASNSYADACGYLTVEFHKATNQDSIEAVTHEISQTHGRIEFYGEQVLRNGESTQWLMNQNTFAGPEGDIVYAWNIRTPEWNGRNQYRVTEHKCKVHYNQSYCGFYFWTAENYTTV